MRQWKRGTPRNYKWFLSSTSALIKTVTKFSNTVDSVVGQLKGQWTHHACVSGQNASCARAVVLHYNYFIIFFMKTYNRCLVSFRNFVIVLISSDFVYHSFDYRPNWILLVAGTIVNRVGDNQSSSRILL